MAEVWAARQLGELGFSRIVALKMILPELAEDAAFRKMFLEEARLASGIRHANVVEVLDLGEAGSIVFQAMPLLDGDSLSGLQRRWQALGRRGGLPEGLLLRILCDALAGLHAAHELRDEEGHPLQVVHRDVSPQNILVGLDGVARIADFGVAKALGRLAEETEAGQIKGKYGYLAPELVERRPADRRSDLFSAGVVLWEALTCTRLFKGQDAIETLDRVRNLEIPDPRSVNAEVSPAVAEATMRALARQPEERYATAAGMADALNHAARSIGATVTTNEVSAFVRELVSSAGSEHAHAEPALTTVAATVAAEPTQRDAPARSRTLFWLGATAVIAVAIGGAALARGRMKPEVRAPADAVPAVTEVIPRAPPVPAPSDSAASAPLATPAVSTRAVPTSRRPQTPMPKPKFGNPYDR
jgi:serine/threonine-protein kinase